MSIKVINKCLVQALKDNDVDWIVHQVNMQGVMGSGIAKQIKQEFPNHYKKYLEYCKSDDLFLGSSFAEDGVVGVFGQEYYGSVDRNTNYVALVSGMEEYINHVIREYPSNNKIGIPHGIGCGLGGGSWKLVSILLEDLQKMYPEVELILYKL